MNKENENPQSFRAVDRQRETFLSGMVGKKPLIPFDLNQLEEQAKEKMDPNAFTYVVGGAGKDDTGKQNCADFQKWKILPRMLKGVAAPDTSIELFGQQYASPMMLAPIASLDLAHPDGEIAVAKACTKANIPFIFSNQASYAMEDCASAMGNTPRWFQLYWSKHDELTASFIHRAEACGCSAIVVTVDTNMLGWRIPDLDNAYLPFVHGSGIAQYTSDPVFQKLLNEPDQAPPPKTPSPNFTGILNVLRLMWNFPGGFINNLSTQRPLKVIRKFTAVFSKPTLSWEDLSFLKQHTELPIIIKGILHPEDAKIALDHGVDGIIVSNHGGRQLDGSVSAIDALPGVVKAVNGQIPILMDSGIRGGADMFKAIALGAKAVCLGRPYVYALALAGEQGVLEVLKNMMADFEVTMGLAGCRQVSEINREMLVPDDIAT